MSGWWPNYGYYYYTGWDQYPHGYAYPVPQQGHRWTHPNREYRPAAARTPAVSASRASMPKPTAEPDNERDKETASDKDEKKRAEIDEETEESESEPQSTVVVKQPSSQKEKTKKSPKEGDHRGGKSERTDRGRSSGHESEPAERARSSGRRRDTSNREKKNRSQDKKPKGSAQPRSPVDPPKSQEASALDPRVQCTMCGKWVSKRGFEQHWQTNLACIQKQKASRGDKPDVETMHEWLQCHLCKKWCQGEYGLKQHMDVKHPHLQSLRRRSRSPSGSGSAGPSASQVVPASKVSSRRPIGGRNRDAKNSIRLRENPDSQGSRGSAVGDHGSRGSVVGDGTGSNTETLADLFQATANLLRRTS